MPASVRCCWRVCWLAPVAPIPDSAVYCRQFAEALHRIPEIREAYALRAPRDAYPIGLVPTCYLFLPMSVVMRPSLTIADIVSSVSNLRGSA
jgi:hypothetical protein